MPDAEKVERSLRAHHVPEELIEQILAGKAAPGCRNQKEERAHHLIEVVKRLEEQLGTEASAEIMDWCACCKTGQRDQDCKRYARTSAGGSLQERIVGLAAVRYMGQPRLNQDGTISTSIAWAENGRYRCPCPIFIGLELQEAVSTTYCTCCAGHFRYHYQNALRLKLKTRMVASSAINSLGEKPCQFIYEICE